MALGRAIERFDAKHHVTAEGCWRWIAAHTPPGYGCFYWKGRQVYAHRFSYEVFVGPIPEGLVIDHLCQNKWCINPWHLEAVTYRANLMRADTVTRRNAHKVECDSGHPYTEANTYYYANGSRRCRQCGTEQARERRRRRAA